MDHLWAPWRLAYVTKDPLPKVGDDCFICRGLAANDDRANQIVARGALCVVLLNKYPYNNGHLLVAPRRHLGRLDELSADELRDVNEQVRKMVGVLEAKIQPDGFNIGVLYVGNRKPYQLSIGMGTDIVADLEAEFVI